VIIKSYKQVAPLALKTRANTGWELRTSFIHITLAA
jgi:hypothetical protein